MIEVRDVTRRFGSFTALAGASFAVRSGEIVALLGPNGAGKTTASRIIAGILAPTEGDAVVDDISVRQRPNEVRARCGLVTDSPSLYERMTLRSYLTYFAGLYDVPAPGPRIAELVELMGLSAVLDTKLAAFSRGMKQKAAIARALVHEPKVLLLDEPATALDPEMTQTLRELIVSLRAQHRAILLCTHDLDEAQRISDRVVIVDRGRIVREGATEELRSAGRPSFRAELAAGETAVRAALGGVGVSIDGVAAANGRLEVRWSTDDPAADNTRALRALLDAGVRVISLNAETRSLEDAYLAIIKESRRP
ncbi:MAG TPA: ABC transporter ATP-binding protein [Candidatus Limnocylindria bacterium]|nr:ABC transporter ATP-binding protein [Candidatus Limnocylindria bacterium]